MKNTPNLIGLGPLVCLAFLLVFGFSGSALGQTESKPNSPINKQVKSAIDELLKCNDPNVTPPDPAELEALVEFMTTNSGEGEDINPGRYNGGSGVFWHKSINRPLGQTLRYLYNPAITQEVLYPSSIRVNRIQPESGILKLDRPLWDLLENPADLAQPLIFRNQEWEEITPDDFSGSYYSYNLERLIILFRYHDKPMLLSVGWMAGESEVGKKGGIIEPYSNWDFVYSNEQGATASGIGWADTYMYSSASIVLLYPEGENGESTGYSMFKWLDAGWAGMNMVKKKHILSGAERTFKGVLEVMGQADSPAPEALEQIVSRVLAYDNETLLEHSRKYCAALAELSKDDPILEDEEFQVLLQDGNYARHLSRERLESLVIKLELKRLLGKPVLGD
ncbi:MAG: hypothetical protein LBV80_06160 [Deltaproteobacteria bacterium]|nr:hypothetical protein [Deltaproteobacteria bacterium]